MIQRLSLHAVACMVCVGLFSLVAVAQDAVPATERDPSDASASSRCSVVPNLAAPKDSASSAMQPASSSSAASSDAQPVFWSNPDPNAQVTVTENTLLQVMTNQPLSTRQTRPGAALLFTLSGDVIVNDVLIVSCGATVHGRVVESRQSGTLTGSPDLILQLTALDFGGHSYPLYTYPVKVVGTSKTRPTVAKMKGGAAIGAVVGGIFSGSAKGETSGVGKLAGMGTGAAVGTGVGTAVAAATPGPVLRIPAESEMVFSLSSPISVVPMSEKEARRLSQGLHRGGPVLYVRGEIP